MKVFVTILTLAFFAVSLCDLTEDLDIEVIEKPEKCERSSNKGDMLAMHYRGRLDDGTEFDSR